MRPLAPTLRQLLSLKPTTERPLECTVQAWVRGVRAQKKHAFITISDGSSPGADVQVVATPELAARVTYGSCISVKGKLQPTKGKGQQACDLVADSIDVLGPCDQTFPIQKKEHSNAFLRKSVHLRPRTEAIAKMLRVRDACANSVFACLREMDFTQVDPPLLTNSDCEGGSASFRVEAASNFAKHSASNSFFHRPTYLTVSSQLYLESLAASLGRVFTLSPAFRAERSSTSRHLTEFWMLEVEASFTNDLEQIMSVAEACVRAASKGSESLVLNSELDSERSFACMTYNEAISVLQNQHSPSLQWGEDLNTEQERHLAEKFAQGPVFVTDYPKHLKPFYMRANQADSIHTARDTVACFDLLVPRIGELAGGSLREERLDKLQEAMLLHNMAVEDYDWYLDLRRFGSAPHGGFGLGWERLISLLTGNENVRECVAFPRASEGFSI